MLVPAARDSALQAKAATPPPHLAALLLLMLLLATAKEAPVWQDSAPP
jgi:hypothetical protein